MNSRLRIAGTLFFALVIVATAVMAVLVSGHWLVLATAGPPLLAILYLGLVRGRRASATRSSPAPCSAPRQRSPKPTGPERRVYDVNDPAYLAQQMLEQGRHSLLLRPQIAANVKPEQLQTAMQCLDETMGIVPEGGVLLQSWRCLMQHDESHGQRERLVHVEPLYLDRYPVTNEQYHKFVESGGYENMSLWDPSIWPAVLDFVDRSGHPGPRYWQEGRYPAGLEDHPVVGVSWYEAAAFARWVGKRLPSDPEWVKAGCWPVLTQGTRPMQRRHPWGDTMDRERAHLWGSGSEGTVSVFELPEGVSVGGIYHLVGNVWEWTSSNYGAWDPAQHKLETAAPMKSIRGGAFDTYFDTQAMCQFQSGENPINRKHNIGFRCALSMCDVVATDLDGMDGEEEALVGCAVGAEEEVS